MANLQLESDIDDLLAAEDFDEVRAMLSVDEVNNTSDIDKPVSTLQQAAIDAAVAGLLDFKGGIDCSANPNYPAALKGDTYIVTVAGKIGGASGVVVSSGDMVFAGANNAGGTQASVGTSWATLEANIPGITAAGLALLTSASATTQRTTLGLGNVENTALSTWAGTTSLTTLGTITTGVWNGTVVTGQYGGTGVANTGKTITLGGSLTTSGAFTLTLTITANTDVTLPTTGTLATLSGIETLSNKKIRTSAVLAANHAWDGQSIFGLNAGASISQWAPVYLGASSTWLLADADGEDTYPARGMAVAAYADTNAAEILVKGTARNDAWTWTPGGPIYLSKSAGLTQTAPSAADDVVQLVGFALTATVAFFDYTSVFYLLQAP